MTAAYTVTRFADFADFKTYCQDGAKLPTGKLIAAYYSEKDGHVVVQAV